MASIFDTQISTSECSVYKITNDTGTDDTLIIKKFTYNIENVYTFEEIEQVDIADTFNYIFTAEGASIYSFEWASDAADVVILINTCTIDACILGYVNKLVCCGDCLDCDSTCKGMEWLGKFIATDTLYTLLIDLINHTFGEPAIVYPYIVENYDQTHTIIELMDKIENLCSCTTC